MSKVLRTGMFITRKCRGQVALDTRQALETLSLNEKL